MFTGLIESVCPVKSIRPGSDGRVLTVDLKSTADGTAGGDSIAVNGVCLTVSGITGTTADFDVSGETLEKTTVGELRVGQMVNIERAISPGGRFGGHFVQGHIDGTAGIAAIEPQGEFRNVTFKPEPLLLDDIIKKGSIAVDGISLTVADIDEKTFTAAIIPETWNKTNLQFAKTGTKVNIETDIIVKAVKKQLERIFADDKNEKSGENLTVEKLKNLGF